MYLNEYFINNINKDPKKYNYKYMQSPKKKQSVSNITPITLTNS